MTGKRKSAGAVGRAGRSKADLGQKEAQLEKTQAELEEASGQAFDYPTGNDEAIHLSSGCCHQALGCEFSRGCLPRRSNSHP